MPQRQSHVAPDIHANNAAQFQRRPTRAAHQQHSLWCRKVHAYVLLCQTNKWWAERPCRWDNPPTLQMLWFQSLPTFPHSSSTFHQRQGNRLHIRICRGWARWCWEPAKKKKNDYFQNHKSFTPKKKSECDMNHLSLISHPHSRERIVIAIKWSEKRMPATTPNDSITSFDIYSVMIEMKLLGNLLIISSSWENSI